MTHPYEPDRALADLRTMNLEERVRGEIERIERLAEANPAAAAVTRAHRETAANLRAALADHREGEDDG